MRANRVTLITLSVIDLARARTFYEALGWRVEHAQEEVAFYDLGGLKLGLYSRDKLARDLGKDVADLGTGAMTLAQNFPTETQVDAAYDTALAAGAVELKRPEKVFWGGYSGTFADPDGHVWEYAMNPYWALNEDGGLAK